MTNEQEKIGGPFALIYAGGKGCGIPGPAEVQAPQWALARLMGYVRAVTALGTGAPPVGRTVFHQMQQIAIELDGMEAALKDFDATLAWAQEQAEKGGES